MVRVVSRAASAGRQSRAQSILDKRDKKASYRVQYEQVSRSKGKLRVKEAFQIEPPQGYTFLSLGHAELAEYCKNLSRERDAPVHVVSAHNRHERDKDKISSHLHRVGYHFRTDIFDEGFNTLGYRLVGDKLFRDEANNASGLQRVFDRFGANVDRSNGQSSKAEMESKVKQSIRELFPKIPDGAVDEIFDRAWKEGAGTVGNSQLSLARRVQLATVAHIRHQYTDYDRWLREKDWTRARALAEPLCLRKLVEWRGDEVGKADDMEDILRETIIIDDDDHQDDRASIDQRGGQTDTAGESDSSYEVVQQRANSRDLRIEPSPNVRMQHRYARYLPGMQPVSARPMRDMHRQTIMDRWQQARSQYRGIHHSNGVAPLSMDAYPEQIVGQVHVERDQFGRLPREVVYDDGTRFVRMDPVPPPMPAYSPYQMVYPPGHMLGYAPPPPQYHYPIPPSYLVHEPMQRPQVYQPYEPRDVTRESHHDAHRPDETGERRTPVLRTIEESSHEEGRGQKRIRRHEHRAIPAERVVDLTTPPPPPSRDVPRQAVAYQPYHYEPLARRQENGDRHAQTDQESDYEPLIMSGALGAARPSVLSQSGHFDAGRYNSGHLRRETSMMSVDRPGYDEYDPTHPQLVAKPSAMSAPAPAPLDLSTTTRFGKPSFPPTAFAGSSARNIFAPTGDRIINNGPQPSAFTSAAPLAGTGFYQNQPPSFGAPSPGRPGSRAGNGSNNLQHYSR